MTNERTPRASWIDGIIGAVGFAAAHVIVRVGWRDWFRGGAYPPWFLNSGRAAAFTAMCFFGVGVVMRVWRRSNENRHPALAAVGAVVALVVTLASIGAGTLFPIVILFGALIVTACLYAGWYAGRLLDGR